MAVTMQDCPNCGAARRPGSRFCFHCGTAFGPATPPTPPPQEEPHLTLGVAGAAVGSVVGGILWYVLVRSGPMVGFIGAGLAVGLLVGYLTPLLAGAAGMTTRMLAGAAVIFAVIIRDVLFITESSGGFRLGPFIRFVVLSPRYLLPVLIAVGVAVIIAGFRAWVPSWDWRAG